MAYLQLKWQLFTALHFRPQLASRAHERLDESSTHSDASEADYPNT
jgi:hypothetical protein